jgi:hypothetical protein
METGNKTESLNLQEFDCFYSDLDTLHGMLNDIEYSPLSTSERLDALEGKIDGAIDKVAVDIKSSLADIGTMLDNIEARETKGHFSCPITNRR